MRYLSLFFDVLMQDSTKDLYDTKYQALKRFFLHYFDDFSGSYSQSILQTITPLETDI